MSSQECHITVERFELTPDTPDTIGWRCSSHDAWQLHTGFTSETRAWEAAARHKADRADPLRNALIETIDYLDHGEDVIDGKIVYALEHLLGRLR